MPLGERIYIETPQRIPSTGLAFGITLSGDFEGFRLVFHIDHIDFEEDGLTFKGYAQREAVPGSVRERMVGGSISISGQHTVGCSYIRFKYPD